MFNRLLLLFLLVAPAVSAQTSVGGGAIASGGVVLNAAPTTPVTVSVSPTTATTVVNSQQVFTVTLTNDLANAGASLALSGPSCSGVTCGSLSKTSVTNGQTVTYTAPATVPTNPDVTLTVTALQDNARFQISIIVISGTPQVASVCQFTTAIPEQNGAASNTFPIPNGTCDTQILTITSNTGSSITGVVDQANNAFTIASCQADNTGGHAAIAWRLGGSFPVLTAVTIASVGAAGGHIDIGYIDASTGSTTQPDVAAVCGGSNTSTTNPVGPPVTTVNPGDLVVSVDALGVNGSAVQPPFVFGLMGRGDVSAYALAPTVGVYSASYTTASGPWAGMEVAFRPGTQPGVVTVNVTPTSQNIQVGATQGFTAIVTNDTTNSGVTWTATGSGCSGATCGTVSPTSSASGATVTYTAPNAVPSPPTVSVTATSVANGTKSATAAVTVLATPSISVNTAPASLSVPAGGSGNSFTATLVNDTQNLGVTWVLSSPKCTGSACGILSATSSKSGVPITYTPPASVTSVLTLNLTATSVSDPTKNAVATITVTLVVGPFVCNGSCPAFPGAQGGGAATPGGRGGVVYNVNTINDTTNASCVPFNAPNQTCSLRDCIQATGARTCVFSVSGVFGTGSRLTIANPFITIAGQTAPGGAIVVGGLNQVDVVLFMTAHDVVVRYITYDGNVCVPGQPCGTGPAVGSVGFEFTQTANNIVIDHTSARWWGNKVYLPLSNGVPGQSVFNMSIENNLMYEPNAAHPVICAPDATSGSALNSTNIDWFRNVGINYDHRFCLYDIRSSRFVNNISYNHLQLSGSFIVGSWGGLQADFISNKFQDGPQSVNPNHVFNAQPNQCSSDASNNCPPVGPADNPGPPSFYFLNNIGHAGTNTGGPLIAPTNVVNDAGQISMTAQGGEGGDGFGGAVGPYPGSWFRATPLQTQAFPIVAVPVTTLDSSILPTVGNSQHLDSVNCLGAFLNNRDSQDARVIAQYQALGPGTMFNNQFTAPAVPNAPACVSTVHDGIPDAWKTHFGLSTTDAGLAARVDPNLGNVYTYLDAYLNGLNP